MFVWIKNLRRGGATVPPGKSMASLHSGAVALAASAPGRAAEFVREGNDWLERGNLSFAEHSFRQAALADPAHAVARVNLGYVLCEQKSFEEARTILEQAITLDASNVDAHYMLGLACKELRAVDVAIKHLRRSLELKPDFAFAMRELCALMAINGQAEEASVLLERGIAIRRDSADFHFLRGTLLIAQGAFEDAAAALRQALAQTPGDASICVNLGLVLMRLDQNDEAAGMCERALELNPDCSEAHVNLAAIYRKLDQMHLARSHCAKALDLRPNDPNAHSYMGLILKSEGHTQDAIAVFQKALTLDARHLESLVGLGEIHHSLGDLKSALDYKTQIVAVQPDRADSHNNLGALLHEIGDLDGAMACYREALRIDDKFGAAHCNLGSCHLLLGQRELAIAGFRAALKLQPDSVAACSNLLFTLSSDSSCPPGDYLIEAKRYGALVARLATLLPQSRSPSLSNEGSPLRVGFLSGDFREHPVGRFLETTLAQIDATRIELVAFSTHTVEDGRTNRLRPMFQCWNRVAGLSDEAIAKKIRAQNIDILVDLSGHTANNRLPVFGWRPAPVQVSWLGYWASTGIAEVDYVLVDPISATKEMASHFVEKFWYLPESRMCYTAPEFAHSIAVHAAPHVVNGYLTFGSFQTLGKINGQVLSAWSRVLQAAPTSRLIICSSQLRQMSAQQEFTTRLIRAGIPLERTKLRGWIPFNEYFSAYSEIDLILDTFPFTGGTTTCEALWMGVPTLTLAGETLISRQGASLMTNAGLPEFVTYSTEEYVSRAAALAQDSSKLDIIRAGLRDKVRESPLFDGKRFARKLEDALIGMWRQKMAG